MAQYRGFPWRFLFTNLSTVTTSWANGLLTGRTVTSVLDQPTQIAAAVRPDDPRVNQLWTDGYPRVAQTNRLIYGFRREAPAEAAPWVCRAAGILMAPEDEGDADVALTHFTAYDPWQLMFGRAVVDPGGNLPTTATGYFIPNATGDVIAGTVLLNTILAETTYGYAGNGTFIDAGPSYGGTAFWGGTIETTPFINLTMQRGSSVGSVWQQLCDAGNMDIVLRPIYDPVNRPGYTHELSIYHLAGRDLTHVRFAWDRLNRNAKKMDRMHSAVPGDYFNKGQYFSGQGGWPVPALGPLIPAPADVVTFGPYWSQEFQAQQTDTDPTGTATLALLQQAIKLAKQGKRTVTIDPIPERSAIPLLDYECGDRVDLRATRRLRATVDGLERVQTIPIQITDDGVEEVVGLVVSPDWRNETPPPPEGPRITYTYDGAETLTIAIPTVILVGLDPADLVYAAADDGSSAWAEVPITADPVVTYGATLTMTTTGIVYNGVSADYFVTPRDNVVFRVAVLGIGSDMQDPTGIEPNLALNSIIGPIVTFDYGVAATARSGPFNSLPLPHPVPAGGGGGTPTGGAWNWDASTATEDPDSAALITDWLGYAVGAGTYFTAAVAVQDAPGGTGAYNIPTSESVSPVAVPAPSGTVPGGSADLSLTIRQGSTDYDLSLVHTSGGTITDAFGITVSPITAVYEAGPGGNNANAACFPLRQGPITLADIESGSIDHPLVFTMPNCGPAPNRYPARPGSSGYPGNTGFPLGTWIRLDPGVDVPSLGLPSLETMICVCLQKWGMFLRDIGSTLDIIAVDPVNQGSTESLWAGAGVTLTIPGVAGYNYARALNGGMPWSSMQVLVPPGP